MDMKSDFKSREENKDLEFIMKINPDSRKKTKNSQLVIYALLVVVFVSGLVVLGKS